MATEGNMAAKTSPAPVQAKDDVLTVVAISFVAEMVGDVVHEGVGACGGGFAHWGEVGGVVGAGMVLGPRVPNKKPHA